MSKYTTEVRFLCESLTGHTESKGLSDVDNILTEASPIIFSFQFPIFDEAYRLPLERKILRHYYTREISEETYGLWKLRLQDRMGTIMPYYNKLYESALLSFNPFYDVDLTTNHAGNQSGVVDTNERENRERDNEIDRKANEHVDEVGNKVGNNSEDKTGTNQRKSEGNETENAVKNTTFNGVENNKLESTNDHTGTIKDDNTGEHLTVNNDASVESVNGSKQGDTDSNYESVNTANGNSTKTVNTTGTNNNTQWDLFSDTPQGGIDGMEIPNGSAPSALNNHMYLTTARKVMDNGGTTSNSNEGDISSNVGTDNGSGKEKTNETTTQHVDNVANRVENGSTSESNVKTYNEKNEIKNGGSKENVNTGVEVTDSGRGNTVKEEGSDSQKTSGIYSEVNVNNIGRNNDENIKNNENMNADRMGTTVSTTTDEYLQRVSGKSGGMSYSAMLLEYRETFINIDEMIIEELSDLFFGLW